MNASQRRIFPAAVRDLIIFVGSVLLVLIFTRFSPNMFFADDNAMQWEAVTREVFDNLFSDGYIAYRNIYQYKGIDIFSSGYYGQTNIFMLVSYLISRFVFGGNIHIVSVYIPMLYGLGNVFMTRLLSDCFNARKSTVCVLVAMYSCVTIFFSYSFYYFTFNNYFFIPFFLWIFMKTRDNGFGWFAPGLVLSLGLYLGHAQYAFYYVIIYAIIAVSLAVIRRDIKEILTAAANAGVYLALSAAYLLCLLGASSDRSMIFIESEFFSHPMELKYFIFPINLSAFMRENPPLSGFHDMKDIVNCGFIALLFFLIFIPAFRKAVSLFELFFFADTGSSGNSLADKIINRRELAPVRKMVSVTVCVAMVYLDLRGIFRSINIALTVSLAAYLALLLFTFAVPDKSKNKGRIMHIILYIIIILFAHSQLFLFLLILLFAQGLKKIKTPKKEYPHNLDIIYAISAAALFFLLLSFGEKSLPARLLYHVPVINSFRFLYKCAFLIIPLMMPTAAYSFEQYIRPKLPKASVAASCCCAVLQGISICFLLWGGNIDLLNQSRYNFVNHESYTERSRVLFEEKITDSRNYRFLACANKDLTESTSKITACNYECPYKYTKNYATVNGIFTLGGYDNIFTTESFGQSDEIMSDIIIEGNYSNAVCSFDRFDEIAESLYRKQRFEQQMVENSVKYVLFTKSDTEFIASFERLIDMCPRLSIIDRFDGLEDVRIISLDGVKPICSDTADDSCIVISPKIAELSFNSVGVGQNVKISLTYDRNYRMTLNGKEIPLFRTDDGYITADIPAEAGEVRLYYENRLMDTAMLTAIITTVLSAVLTAICLCKKSPDTV